MVDVRLLRGGREGDDRSVPGVAGFFRVVPVDAETTRQVPTELGHGFRRTAVRDLSRAGIPARELREARGRLTAAALARDSATVAARSGRVAGLAC